MSARPNYPTDKLVQRPSEVAQSRELQYATKTAFRKATEYMA
jgi:hypothetical protein